MSRASLSILRTWRQKWQLSQRAPESLPRVRITCTQSITFSALQPLTIYLIAPRSPFQTGVRTSGRAFNSPNWRMKSEESPGAQSPRSPSHQTNSSRSPFSRSTTNVPQSISEGRRLYVGNMPYSAKAEDVETLFPRDEYQMCDDLF